MTRAVFLFVHGTGVRSAGYAGTYKSIKDKVTERGLQVKLQGCFWGDSEGARLHRNGRSIPEYAAARGGRSPTPEDVQTALWAILYLDPWYELRLLRNFATAEKRLIGQEPPFGWRSAEFGSSRTRLAGVRHPTLIQVAARGVRSGGPAGTSCRTGCVPGLAGGSRWPPRCPAPRAPSAPATGRPRRGFGPGSCRTSAGPHRRPG